MKIGRKYLYSSSKGSYYPVNLGVKQYIALLKKELEQNYYPENLIEYYKRKIKNYGKHGKHDRRIRKGLNSTLRHLARKIINDELCEIQYDIFK